MKHNSFKRGLAFFLTLCLCVSLVPTYVFSAGAAGDRVADPSTMNDWTLFFGETVNSTDNAGAVWTDKSVFTNAAAFDGLITMKDAERNFLVALSALAANKSIVGYSHIPTDTMLVLDVSASMGTGNGNNDAIADLVEAANEAIKSLQGVNNYNRVGVVLYSGNTSTGSAATPSTGKVLLPLDRYTANDNGVYLLSTNGDDRVTIASGVKDGDGNEVSVDSKDCAGGTYTQNGIYLAMKEFLEVEDTTIQGTGFQAGTTRMPIMVLMSDGNPTIATNNYMGSTQNGSLTLGNSNIGTGSSNVPEETTNAVIFTTQLTAAYAKARIEEHYGRGSLMYTLGFNLTDTGVLNPAATSDAVRSHWSTYLALSDGASMQLLTGTTWERVEGNRPGGGNGNRVEVPVYTSIAKSTYDLSLDYVDQYFSARTSLTDTFQTIVEQIILQSLYYPTLAEEGNYDMDGYISFVDNLGHFMDVKHVHGIVLGDTLFTGAAMAKNYVTGGQLGTAQNPTDLGNEMIHAIIERLGIKDTADETAVQIARDLVHNAWEDGQLYYNSDTDFSSYIGWYADANGNYLGFAKENGTPDKDAVYHNRSYGLLGKVVDGHRASDMMHVSIQVRTEIATGNQIVIFRIPASLIPVISYNVSLTGTSLQNPGDITLTLDDTDSNGDKITPIRLVYEVGLNDGINELTVAEAVKNDTHFMEHHVDGNKYNFYSNYWSDSTATNHPVGSHNAIAYYEPSKQNERYYYTENSLIYVKDGNDYVPLSASRLPSYQADTYYRAYSVFEKVNNNSTNNAIVTTHYEEISANAFNHAEAFGDGTWYIPMGTVHSMLKSFAVEKTENKTDTFKYSDYPMLDLTEDDPATPEDETVCYYADYLGNNGRLTLTAAQGLKLTKENDATVNNPYDYFYTFRVETANAAVNGVEVRILRTGAYGDAETNTTFRYDDARGTYFAEFNLLASETVYVLDLPENVTYTVSEVAGSNYQVLSVNGDESLKEFVFTVREGVISETTFVNTHRNPLDYLGDYLLTKTVVHPLGAAYQIPTDLKFTFEIVADFGTNDVPALLNDGALKTVQKQGSVYYIVDANGNNPTLGANQKLAIYGLPEGTVVTATEKVPLAAGFTTADAEKTVTIVAKTTVTAEIVNTYAPSKVSPVNINVVGGKILNNREWLDTDVFTFKLQKLTSEGWVDLDTQTATKISPLFNFSDKIQAEVYDKVGTYEYRVIEVHGTIGGISYDNVYRYFSVQVTDETMDGILEVKSVTDHGRTTVSYETASDTWTVSMEFTNSYAPAGSAEVEVEVEKNVSSTSGATISKMGFVFGLYQGENLLIRSDETDANGKTTFRLTFGAADVGANIYYTLKEIKPDNAPNTITYDTREYTVHIEVIDNKDGTISAVATITDDNGQPQNVASFENVFDPHDATLTLEGVKKMIGRDLTADDVFHFLATETDANGDPIPDGKVYDGVSSMGNISFETMTFTAVGTYFFTVSEVAGDPNKGITYDDNTYALKITVTEVGGRLVATASLKDKTAPVTKDDITFTNEYNTTGATLKITGNKDMNGRDLTPNDRFEFLISESDGNKNLKPNGKVYRGTNNSYGVITFETMTFDAAGTYHFVISEVEGEADKGIEYDETTYMLTVTVTDDGEGKLVATYVLERGRLLFVNEYTAKEATLVLQGEKDLNGRDMTANDVFSFLAKEANSIGEIVPNGKQYEGTNDIHGDITFETMTFTAKGTYYFVVSEVEGAADKGITYDPSTYLLTVTVTDNGEGQLVAAPNLTKTDLVFTNAYTTKNATLVLEGIKKMDGRDLTANDVFTFLAAECNQNGRLLQDGEIYEGTNNIHGDITFETMTFTSTGVYYFLISEQEGETDKGISYDTATTYILTVTVTDDGEGKLVATPDKTKNDIVFENTYEAKDATLVLEGIKKMDGRDLTANDIFTFLASEANVNGELIPNGKVYNGTNVLGDITFETMTFTEAGTYHFVISEKAGAADKGITYDTATTYILTVIVTDDGEGKLVATPNKTKADIVFENTYEAKNATLDLEGVKNLTGRDLRNGEFSFLISEADANGKLVANGKVYRGTNDTQKKITFETMTFTEAKTYYYVISEVKGAADVGLTYDETTYLLIVTVTDDGNGKLVASANLKTEDIVFNNTYKANGADVSVSGTKTLIGRDLENGEFVFNLHKSDADGTVGDKVTFAANNGKNFTLSWNEPAVGTFYYVIVEDTSDKAERVEYDPAKYLVKVVVTDDGDGQLDHTVTVTKNGTAAEVTFTNVYTPRPADLIFSVTADKTVTNGPANGISAEGFEFLLKNLTADLDWTKKTNANGKAIFEITFTEDDIGKTYKFALSEVKGNADRMTYDTTVHEFSVTISLSADNKLVATVANDAKTQVSYKFTNVYTPKPDDLTFSVTVDKTVTNGAVNGIAPSGFEFLLKNITANKDWTAKSNANGKAFFEITFTEDDIGKTYKFALSEVKGNADRMTYDTTVHEFSVTISLGADNKLVATVANDAKTQVSYKFTNVYTPKPADVSFSVNVNKVVTNGDEFKISPEGFEFLLKDLTNNKIQTLKSNAQGKATFSLTFTEADIGKTYKFALSEVAGTAEGITYDTTVYEFTVTVSLSADNKLVLTLNQTASASSIAATFTNVYTPQIPETSDAKNLLPWMSLAVAAGAVVMFNRKRKEEIEE